MPMSQECHQRTLSPRCSSGLCQSLKLRVWPGQESPAPFSSMHRSKVARAPVELCSRGASPRPRLRAGRRAAFPFRPRNGTSARSPRAYSPTFRTTDCWNTGLLTDGDIVTSSGVAGDCKTVSNAWSGSAFGISTGALAVDVWPSGEMRPGGWRPALRFARSARDGAVDRNDKGRAFRPRRQEATLSIGPAGPMLYGFTANGQRSRQ
jgi:hypothetical protein